MEAGRQVNLMLLNRWLFGMCPVGHVIRYGRKCKVGDTCAIVHFQCMQVGWCLYCLHSWSVTNQAPSTAKRVLLLFVRPNHVCCEFR